MARQPYETRLVLGRSAYLPPSDVLATAATEGSSAPTNSAQSGSGRGNHDRYVQQYDSQGHAVNPRSKDLARQSRRAQNDILSTVNVCVRVDRNGLPVVAGARKVKSPIYNIRQENHCGLLLGTADWCLFCLASLSLVSLRHRLQSFSFYNELSLSYIIKTEWNYLGPRGFLFPGALATFLFRYLEHARPQVIRSLYNRFTRRFIWPVRSGTHRKQLRVVMDVLEQVFKAVTFALIAPLEIFATLQRLNLAPTSLLLPPVRSLIPFSSYSPFQLWWPSHEGLRNDSKMFASSPLILLWLLLVTKSRVDERLYVYIGNVLPKPASPTSDSEEAAREDHLTNEHILGLPEPHDSRLTSNDFRQVFWGLVQIPVRMMNWVQWRGRSSAGEAEELRDLHLRATSSNTDGHASISPMTSFLTSPSPVPRDSMPAEAEPAEDITRTSQHYATARERQRFLSEQLRNAFPKHRVTALTSHTADALAMHLSTHLADLLFLPLEALFVRSVALGFMSAAATRSPSGPAIGLRNQITPLGRWFGIGISPGGSFQYIKNLVCCGVIEVAVGLGIWQLSTWTAWYMGRKWFGWGVGEFDEAASERDSNP